LRIDSFSWRRVPWLKYLRIFSGRELPHLAVEQVAIACSVRRYTVGVDAIHGLGEAEVIGKLQNAARETDLSPQIHSQAFKGSWV
jgi:hypothetical protein